MMQVHELNEARDALRPFIEQAATAAANLAIASIEPRVAKLEGQQGRAMLGWGIVAGAGSLASAPLWGWIKQKAGW